MKVFHFLPWASPEVAGGTERYILTLASQQQELGYEVGILYPSEDKRYREYCLEGIKVYALPCIIVNGSQNDELGITEPPGLTDFCDFLEKAALDVLHFHCFWPKHIFYLERAKALGITTIVTFHLVSFSCLQNNLLYGNHSFCDGVVIINKCASCIIKQNNRCTSAVEPFVIGASSVLQHFPSKLLNQHYPKISRFSKHNQIKQLLCVFERINKAASALVALSPWYKKVLLLNGFDANKLFLIETPVEKRFLPRNNQYENKRIKIAFIGRQTIDKGFELLLKALEALPKEKIELIVIGRQYSNGLQVRVNALRKNGFVISQKGVLDHNKVIQELSYCDLLCVPSIAVEMAPLVIREAFSVGVPVLGTNRGGVSDSIIEGYNGFTFRHDSYIDLVNKITMLIANPQLLSLLKHGSAHASAVTPLADAYDNLYSILNDHNEIKYA